MLELCSPCVRSEGDPASGQAKKTKSGSTGLWLRPIAILGDLNLSGIDWTLGDSIRLIPERSNPWNCDRTCPITTDRTQPESGRS